MYQHGAFDYRKLKEIYGSRSVRIRFGASSNNVCSARPINARFICVNSGRDMSVMMGPACAYVWTEWQAADEDSLNSG